MKAQNRGVHIIMKKNFLILLNSFRHIEIKIYVSFCINKDKKEQI